MKWSLTGSIVLLLVFTGHAQWTTPWSAFYDGSATGNDYIWALTDAPGGGVVAGGSSNDLGGGNAWVGRYAESGTLEWMFNADSISPALGGASTTWAVDVSPSGMVAVGGNWMFNTTPMNPQIFVLLLDTNGDTLWVWTHGAPGITAEVANHIVCLGDTGIIVGSIEYTFTLPQTKAVIRRFDMAGNILWQQEVIETVNITDLKVDNAGNTFLVGWQQFGSDIVTAGIAIDGTGFWTHVKDGPYVNSEDLAKALDIGPNGNVVVLAQMSDPLVLTNETMYLASYTPTGVVEWELEIDTLYPELPADLVFDPDGNIDVLARKLFACMMHEYDGQGNSLWSSELVVNDGTWEIGTTFNLVTTSTGEVIAVGQAQGYSGATNYQSSLIWLVSDDGLVSQWQLFGNIAPFAKYEKVVVDASDCIYVAGYEDSNFTEEQDATLARHCYISLGQRPAIGNETLSLHPNPTQGPFVLQGTQPGDRAILLSPLGGLLRQWLVTEPDGIEHAADLAPGCYMVKIERQGRLLRTLRLLVTDRSF